MPDALNHILVARMARSRLAQGELRHILEANAEEYALGAMGMDLFFYYKVLSSAPDPRFVRSLGSRLHKTDPNILFSLFMRYVASVKDETKRLPLLAYVCGVITHHATDSTCHPYIIYFSGGSGFEDGKDYSNSHKRFEQLLDTLVHQSLGEPRFDPAEFRSLRTDFISDVGEMYNSLLQDLYGVSLELSYYKTIFRHTLRILSLTKLRSKFLLNFVLFLEKFSQKEYPISRVIPVPTDDELGRDLLNCSHERWVFPSEGSKTSDASFLELIEDSILLSGKHLLECFQKYICADYDYAPVFHGIDFDSGLPCPRAAYKNIKRKL